MDSTSTPPTSGPIAAPAADAAPQSVIAFICPAPDEATDSRLIPHARIVAPDAVVHRGSAERGQSKRDPRPTEPPGVDSAARDEYGARCP